MKHVRQCGLVKEDMKKIVDLVGIDFIEEIVSESKYANHYAYRNLIKFNKDNALYFFEEHLNSIGKKLLKKFYKELNISIVRIDSRLRSSNNDYENILESKKVRELRNLFEKSKLSNEELKAIPILLKCKNIEYTNGIAFTIDNELYIRKRISDTDKEENDNSQDYINKINKLMLESKQNELELEKKEEKIKVLEKITKDLQSELEHHNPDIGYYSELTQVDYVEIIDNLSKHSTDMKEKFKQLIEKFKKDENKNEYKLYELWMEWTDDEVTIMDDILKKSMYEEVIKQNDLRDLESVSENIMNRYLLSRLLLHFIYRRMSSQCWEEVLG